MCSSDLVRFEESERPLPLNGIHEEVVEMVDVSGYSSYDPTRLGRTKEHDVVRGTSMKGKASTAPSQTLAYSWFRAKRTFFLPQVMDGSHLTPATNPVHRSHLRLRVHPELLYPFTADDLNAAGVGGATRGHVHPSPARFELIRKEVEKQLDSSLNRFIDVSFTNTG